MAKNEEEKAKLKNSITSEKKLTEEAVKKLFKVMQEKQNKPGATSAKSLEKEKRLEKDNKRLQQQLQANQADYNKMLQRHNQEMNAIKEELDKREQEIMKLKSMLNNSQHSQGSQNSTVILSTSPIGHHASNASSSTIMNSSAYSVNYDHDLTIDHHHMHSQDDFFQSWLSIPSRRNNLKKHGWKKVYVVLKKNRLMFFNSLKETPNDPYMIIDLEYVDILKS